MYLDYARLMLAGAWLLGMTLIGFYFWQKFGKKS